MLSGVGLFPLHIRRRQKAIHRQTTNVKIDLFNSPTLLYFPPVVERLAVPVQSGGRPAAVCDVNAVDVSVIFNGRSDAGLPENAVVSLAGFHSDELGVLELDEEAGSHAEVAPNCVVDDLDVWCAL